MNITDTVAGRDLEALRAAIAGQVFVPGEAGDDQAREAWNLAVDERPSVVVVAGSAADVVQAVRYARARGMRIAPQGTGRARPAEHGPQPAGARRGRRRVPGRLPAAAIDALLAVAGPDAQTPPDSVEVRHLGGALARPAPGCGAQPSIDASYLLYAAGATPMPGLAGPVRAHVQAVKDALEPWHASYDY